MTAHELFLRCGLSRRLVDDFLKPTLLVGLFKPPEDGEEQCLGKWGEFEVKPCIMDEQLTTWYFLHEQLDFVLHHALLGILESCWKFSILLIRKWLAKKAHENPMAGCYLVDLVGLQALTQCFWADGKRITHQGLNFWATNTLVGSHPKKRNLLQLSS